jgi:hypothetical protein
MAQLNKTIKVVLARLALACALCASCCTLVTSTAWADDLSDNLKKTDMKVMYCLGAELSTLAEDGPECSRAENGEQNGCSEDIAGKKRLMNYLIARNLLGSSSFGIIVQQAKSDYAECNRAKIALINQNSEKCRKIYGYSTSDEAIKCVIPIIPQTCVKINSCWPQSYLPY